MTKKIVFGVAAVAIAVVVMAPSASASCLGIRNATTFGTAVAYWHPATVQGTLTGQTWQLGNPGAWSTGNCNTNSLGPGGSMVYFTPAGANLNLDMGACGSGCPASLSTLVVLAQNKLATGTEFLLDTIVETPAVPSANFDYGAQGDHNMITMPKPRILSSSRSGTDVNLSIGIDSIAGGLVGPNAGSAVSGFNILSAALPIAQSTDAGRDASAYTQRGTADSPGGAATTKSVAVDCSDITRDQWIVVQIKFEGGTVASTAVGTSARVKCNPALADPTPKNVPKKIGAPKMDGK